MILLMALLVDLVAIRFPTRWIAHLEIWLLDQHGETVARGVSVDFLVRKRKNSSRCGLRRRSPRG
jgi:hypothetical protein